MVYRFCRHDEGGNLRVNPEPIVVPETTERILNHLSCWKILLDNGGCFTQFMMEIVGIFDNTFQQMDKPYASSSSSSIDGVMLQHLFCQKRSIVSMWYARGENGLWDIAYAESIDGENWVDLG